MDAKIHAITLPKLGLTMEEGSIAAWHVEPGDKVNEGDGVADIETEKVTVNYESPVTGTWKKTVAEIGQTLPVGALIGVVADADISDADIDSFIMAFVPETAV